MKILNIHGYHGSAENSAATALKSIGCDVISPSIDYDREEPEQVLNNLGDIIMQSSPDAVVGTSFGGFFAAVLCARHNIPTILVNPCLMPFLHLPRLGYSGDIRKFLPLFAEFSKIDVDKTSTIVGGKDDVIDTHDFTKVLLYNERYTIIPEGMHSGATLPLGEFFAKMLKNMYIGS